MRARAFVFGWLVLYAQPAAADQVGIPDGGETSHRVHLTLDATFTYGIGGYSALGAQLHGLGQLRVANMRTATHSFDFGVVLGFQDEPQALQPGAPRGLENDAQRLNAWVTVGNTFHIGRRRRASLGLHLFAGWTHVWSQASMDDGALDFHRSFSDDYGLANAGGMLKFDYRFSTYVGVTLQAAAPFPIGASYVNTLFHVGLGLTAYFN